MIICDLVNSLSCPVCRSTLVEPVTLSCGSTICRYCLPDGPTAERNTFVCPVPGCIEPSHLFGPTIENDVLLGNLTTLLTRFLAPVSPSSSIDASGSSDDLTIQGPDLLSRALESFLTCQHCNRIMKDPVTAQCGHTFCRLCLLSMKIHDNMCNLCTLLLPAFHRLKQLAANKILDPIVQQLQQEQQQDNYGQLPRPIYKSNIPIFDSGYLVLLPNQRARFTIPPHAPSLPTRPIEHYKDLCLAIVSRLNGRELAHVGTLARVTAVEQHIDRSMTLEVVGLDWFMADNYHQQGDDVILADITIVPEDHKVKLLTLPDETENRQHVATCTTMNGERNVIREMAIDIYCFLHDLANGTEFSTATTTTTLHTNVTGILGPDWLAKAEAAHGELPLPSNPGALTWWAAAVLPLSASNRYTLLRTMDISARLSLVLSWIRQLEASWTRFRGAAIQAISTAFLQQEQYQEQFWNAAL